MTPKITVLASMLVVSGVIGVAFAPDTAAGAGKDGHRRLDASHGRARNLRRA